MFDRQAEDLRKLMAGENQHHTDPEEQRQLKEVYDDIEREQREKDMELESLRSEQRHISTLLDTYGVPRKANGKYLSILERLDIALKARGVA